MLYYRLFFKSIILTFFIVLLSTLPAYSQAVCRNSTSVTPDCPDFFHSAVCSNYVSPFSSGMGSPCCKNGQPGCEFIQTLPFELVCDTTIVPACQCNTSILSMICTLSNGLLPDTSNCTCKCFSGTGCPNYNKCCPFGCCPSNPNQCKCPFNDQCYPFPDLSSSEIAFFCTASTTIYTCDPGYTSCPDNMTEGLCCQYGCCPSDPTKCKCSNNNQCSPNCTTSDLTACNSTYPSCNGTCPAGQECSPSVSGTNVGCSCFPTASSNPTMPAPDTNSSCKLPCSNSSACGVGKYCNLNAMCCVVNPSGCIKGCHLSSSECGSNEQCVSNCCVPLIVPESSLVWCTSDLDHNETVCGNQERTLFILNNRNIKRGISLTFMWKNKNLEKSVNCEILSSNKFVTVSPAYTSSSLLDYKKDYAQVVINRRYARILKKTRQAETVTITGSCTDGSEIGNLDIVLTPP